MPSEADGGHAAIPLLVVTGPVGAGKTTVAQAISDLLAEHEMPHAVIDQDWLRWCHPSPAHDPFQTALGLKNLAAVCANYRAAGANYLVVADVVETRAEREAYRAAVPGAAVTIVRLNASLPTLHARLARRETGDSLAWYHHRAGELTAIMERNGIGDFTVDTEERSAGEVAREIVRRLRWVRDEE